MAPPSPPPHVAFLASPGMGHLIPVAELAKNLVTTHNFTATIITYTNFNSTSQLNTFLSSLPSSISSLSLPLIPLDDLPSDSRIETSLCVLSSRAAPSLVRALHSLKESTNLVAYVSDLFGFDTLALTKHLSIPRFLLFTSNFFTLSFMFHLPELDETTSCKFRDLESPLELPGCVPLSSNDFHDALRERTNDVYPWMVRMAKKLSDADGIFVNSFAALEPAAARALSEHAPTVYPIGPIIRLGTENRTYECVKWLDRQPRDSVIFVSFGSGGTLSCQQTNELALGLEQSGCRFIWVVHTPSDSTNAMFFSVTNSDDPLDYLPNGFVSRTGELGLVIPNWAPQMEILAHSSVGGFLTHCGWNSTLESIMHGVPMIAWPLYAEQRMNAVMLTEGIKIATRVKEGEDGVIGRGEICTAVKELMVGEKGKELRDRIGELKNEGRKAIEKDGDSCVALASVVNKWKDFSSG